MERFCEDVIQHMCLDFDNEEVNDISEAVTTMLDRLMELVNLDSQYKFSKLVPCGSMKEKVRIWNFMRSERNERAHIEFDFLALMQSDEMQFVSSCQRSVRVINGHNSEEDCYDANAGLHDSIFWSIDVICHCYSVMSYVNIPEDFVHTQGDGCEKCIVIKPTGCLSIYGTPEVHTFSRRHSDDSCQLELEWTSKRTSLSYFKFTHDLKAKRTPLKRLIIIVDIHPAFEVIKTTDKQSHLQSLKEFRQSATSVSIKNANGCHIVAIRCENVHSKCWRVSHCEAEMEIFKGTTLQHRQAYMILKFIRDRLFKDNNLISSYHMKTAVLRHIEQCTDNGSNCTVHRCVQSVIDYLITCFYSQTIPDIVHGANILFCSSTFESKTVEMNLSYVFGDSFVLVNTLFSDYLGNGTYSFQKALKYLECVHSLVMCSWEAAVGRRQYKACSDTEELKTELNKIVEDYRNVDDKVRVVFDTLFEVKDLESQITEDNEIHIEICSRISLPKRRNFPARRRRRRRVCTLL